MSLQALTADYFIAHEMGHLNHSVSFWVLVASLQAHRDWLKDNGRCLTL